MFKSAVIFACLAFAGPVNALEIAGQYSRADCAIKDAEIGFLISDEKFVIGEGYGCSRRISEWTTDDGWTQARFTDCWHDYDNARPDQLGAFRLVNDAGAVRVDLTLFPEDGIVTVWSCAAPDTVSLGLLLGDAYNRREAK